MFYEELVEFAIAAFALIDFGVVVERPVALFAPAPWHCQTVEADKLSAIALVDGAQGSIKKYELFEHGIKRLMTENYFGRKELSMASINSMIRLSKCRVK